MAKKRVMNKRFDKGIVLAGVFFCLCACAGSRAYGQAGQVENIDLTGFPADEILLRGESRKVKESSLETSAFHTLPKSLGELSAKRKIAEKEPRGNLRLMQKMSQYPEMDISGQMKRLRALQWTGRGLWISGSLLMTTGVILASSWFWPEEYLAPLMLGVAFVGGGVPMDVIYTRKIKALKKTRNYSASLDFGNQRHGVGFGLHF